MKKSLFAIGFAVLTSSLLSQTVYKHKVDGQIYLKVQPGILKAVQKDNPSNIVISKLGSLSQTLFKYGATKVFKPFYQADDDAVLPYVLQVQFSQINQIDELIADLSRIKGVEYAEPVNLNTVDLAPNDPHFTGGTMPYLNQINAQNAWNVSTGSLNITVAVIDNAVDRSHPDLSPNVWTNPGEIAGDGIDNDMNGYIDDVNGWDAADGDNNTIPSNNSMNHGTHCSGTAAGRTNNSTGPAAISWNVSLIPVKCQTNGGSTTGIVAGYQGIVYAAKVKARVISCSWGGPGTGSAAEQAVINYAWGRGCIVIAAAGNSNTNALHYPAAYNNVYSVASVGTGPSAPWGTLNVKSGFSNYGTWVDICAPGENIRSTYPANTYGYSSGTSMATPCVAGLAALMLSRSPQMTATDVLNCINSTAVNIYPVNSGTLAGQLGAGRIEAYQAMLCAAGFSAQPVVSHFYAPVRLTCPSTPISFVDSSLYLPTAWSWTFQAGTPATSTSSNPSVSWATPGTFSVALQATNPNGGNVNTKVSYITVAGPQLLPLTEGFQATTFVPSNWTPVNIDNDGYFWKRRTGLGAFGTSTACAWFDNYNEDVAPARDEIRTPKYVFSSVTQATLRFDVAYRQYDNQYSDTLEVKLSTNCGTSWTTIYSRGGSTLSTVPGTLTASQFTPTTAQWRTDSVNITSLAAGQANVMIAFVNRGHYGQALFLDNINLRANSASFNNPASACSGAAVTMTNTSSGAVSYSWSTSGGGGTSTATNPTFSFSTTGIQTITLTAINGTNVSVSTKTINVTSGPPLTVTGTSSICSGSSANITASGATSYSWNTGSTTNSISVSPLSTTIYSVTGTTGGCSTFTTYNLNVTTTPTVVVANQTICAGGTATLNATGATTYSWNTGSTANPITVTPASNTNYTVIGFNGSCTNTKTLSVNIGSSISINLTPAIPQLCIGNSLTITASGAATYTWNTGSNAASIVVNPTVATNYTVSGTNAGCNGTNAFSVAVNSNPTASGSATNISCNGLTNGMLLVNPASGTAPYTYSWTPGGQTTANVNGLGVGSYSCVVTDSKGCKVNFAGSITQPSALTNSINNSPASCGVCTNGSATVSVSGGTSPYTYNWLPSGGTAATATSLAPQCYTVNITDANGCANSATTCVSFASGISNLNISENLSIYPNPSNGIVVVELQGAFNLVVHNQLGQLILNQQADSKATLNFSEYAKGVYTIQISQEGNSIYKKLILE
ncbi:MAG: S8 family serine peptidase [Bacteroidetes bacterium]|nr:S8 family serine peptidase [Bacteroidota bacterium]